MKEGLTGINTIGGVLTGMTVKRTGGVESVSDAETSKCGQLSGEKS